MLMRHHSIWFVEEKMDHFMNFMCPHVFYCHVSWLQGDTAFTFFQPVDRSSRFTNVCRQQEDEHEQKNRGCRTKIEVPQKVGGSWSFYLHSPALAFFYTQRFTTATAKTIQCLFNPANFAQNQN